MMRHCLFYSKIIGNLLYGWCDPSHDPTPSYICPRISCHLVGAKPSFFRLFRFLGLNLICLELNFFYQIFLIQLWTFHQAFPGDGFLTVFCLNLCFIYKIVCSGLKNTQTVFAKHLRFDLKITKVMKITEWQARIKTIMKILESHFENYENHEYLRIQYENK